MGSYADAVARARGENSLPDTASVRRYGSNSGVALNLEQALSTDLGAFARAGVKQGKKEPLNSVISTVRLRLAFPYKEIDAGAPTIELAWPL